MREAAARDTLARQFELFAKTSTRDDAPLYARISEGVAKDPEILGLVAASPPSQQNPTLLFACVHDLLLAGHAHPLARYYPTVTVDRPLSAAEGDPFAEFASFCGEHRRELTVLLGTRSTQTNEVGRCAVLLPALHVVAARHSRPLAIADLGASAGLNLLFDRYAYDYGSISAGEAGSSVRIECAIRHGTLPDLEATLSAPYRTGIDLHPMDLDHDGDCRWLLACQWPDHPDRFRRLDAAIRLARSTPGRPRVVLGDMVEDLERLTADAPPETQLCVLHTWVAAYLSPDEQRALGAVLARIARRRPLTWIFAELPYLVPDLPAAPAPAGQGSGADTELVVVEFADGEARPHRVANVHPHGRWISWWGDGD